MADETTGVSLSTNHIQGKEIEGTSSENPVKLEEEEAHEEPATPTHEIQAETEEGGALDNTIHDNTVEEALGVSASDLNMTTSKESGAELLSKATAAEPEQNDTKAQSSDPRRDTKTQTSSSTTRSTTTSDWIDVLGSGQLMKKVLRPGEGVATRPTPQCQVKMKVRGMLLSGGVVDRHNSLAFTVGDGDVIQAIDIVAGLMERGELCQVKTDARFAYGSQGKSDIPPGSSLIYDLELLEVRPPIDFATIPEQDLVSAINKKRGRGNDLFQRKEYEQAVHSYKRATDMMTNYKQEQNIGHFSPEVLDLWIRCLNNLAAAQLKIEMYNEALESVRMVLDSDPNNVKALYRCGKVLMVKGEMDDAIVHLQKATNLSPDERAIQSELHKAIAKRDEEREKEKAMYKRMMDGSSASSNRSRRSVAVTSNGTLQTNNNRGFRTLVLGAGLVAVAAVGVALLWTLRK